MPMMFRNIALAGAFLISAAAPPAQAEAPAQVTYGPTYAQDRAQIEDLHARYLFAIDYHDWDAYVATFAPDGELEFANGTSKGRDAIRKAVTDFSAGIGRFYHTADGKPAKLRHIILQTAIRVEGDRAWSRSQWLEMANNGPSDEPKIGTYGIYEDEMKRVDSQWLFAKRRVLNEFIPNRNSGPGNPVSEMDRPAERLLRGES
jgi:hypothetical protein